MSNVDLSIRVVPIKLLEKASYLCIAYANNRKEVKAIKDKRNSILIQNGNFNESIIKFFKEVREYITKELNKNFSGWVASLELYLDFDDSKSHWDEEYALAECWDKLKELKQEAGNIKRAIYQVGRQLQRNYEVTIFKKSNKGRNKNNS